MDIRQLEKYSRVYKSGQMMGASVLLRQFLRLPREFVMPLSISHGVDVFQWREPNDIYKAEPVHWAYNAHLYQWSSTLKKSVFLPHPWAIVHSMIGGEDSAGGGDLVVAPPSSPVNDMALYSSLKERGYKNYTVLVKSRGGEDSSVSFWGSMGVTTVSAGTGDEDFYVRLYRILKRFDRVIGCNVSSALIFAASIGKPLQIIDDYTFRVYQRPDYLEFVNFNSQKTKRIVQVLAEGDDVLRAHMSRELLGFSLLASSEKCRSAFEEALGSIKTLFYPPRQKHISELLGGLALLTRRPGFVNISFNAIYSEFIVRRMYEMKVNEFSLWLDGPNSKNLALRKVRPKGGLSVGGRAY